MALITLKGIDEAIENLHPRPDTLKGRLIVLIRSHFTREEDLEEIVALPADELVTALWQVDSPEEIRQKKKNLSSLKSAINKDLKKLAGQDGNPEGVIIGRDNVFTISDEQKNDLLQKLGISSSDSALDLLSAFKEIVGEFLKSGDPETATSFLQELEKTRELVTRITGQGKGGEAGGYPREGAGESREDGTGNDEEIEEIEIAEDEEFEIIEEETFDQGTGDQALAGGYGEPGDLPEGGGEDSPDLDGSGSLADEGAGFARDGAEEGDESVPEDFEEVVVDEDEVTDDTEFSETDLEPEQDWLDDDLEEVLIDEDMIEAEEDAADGGEDAPEGDEDPGDGDLEEIIVDEDQIPDDALAPETDLGPEQEWLDDDFEEIESDGDQSGAGLDTGGTGVDGLAADHDPGDGDLEEIIVDEDQIPDAPPAPETDLEPEQDWLADDLEEVLIDEDITGAEEDAADGDQSGAGLDTGGTGVDGLAADHDPGDGDLEEIIVDEDQIPDAPLASETDLEPEQDWLADDFEEVMIDEDMSGAEEDTADGDQNGAGLDTGGTGVDGLAADHDPGDGDLEEIIVDEDLIIDPPVSGEEPGPDAPDRTSQAGALSGPEALPPSSPPGEAAETSLGEGQSRSMDLSHYIEPEEALATPPETLAESHDEYLAQILERFMPKFIKIPTGTYHLGVQNPRYGERPLHTVTLGSFYIGQLPVTNDLFDFFVRETGYETDAEKEGYGTVIVPRINQRTDPDTGRLTLSISPGTRTGRVSGANWRHPTGPGSSLENKANHPVVQVSRRDALAFAAWAGKRLPTEDEWEIAARGGKGFLFPWGDDWQSSRGNFESSHLGDTCSVYESGRQGMSPFGVYDLLGNVYEWTASIFTPAGKTAGEPSRVFILKGGDWSSRSVVTAASRRLEREIWSNCIGFRCAV